MPPTGAWTRWSTSAWRRSARTGTGQFFDAIADPGERAKIASGNAEALFRLA
jgi:hypothetical protein